LDTEKTFYVHPSAIVDEGCTIGSGSKVWHFSHLMASTIGERCIIGQNVFIASGVVLGNNVKIQNNVSVYEGVICEDDVFLGPSMVFTNILNPRAAVIRKGHYMSTRVGKGASIGANATIVCGHNIGKYAFIGAGAVVTKEVSDYALIMGNPGKQAGWMSEYGHRLAFDSLGIATCPESKQKYQLKENKVSRIQNGI
jgi:UDP-2-acetamido-3-amino-2,3-dideoxy-glucuronate N-acetyltransferase